MSYIVPIGPYHPSLEEPVHARLITDGELIGDDAVRSIIVVDIDTGAAVKRDYAVIPSTEGDNINIYTYSGTIDLEIDASGRKIKFEDEDGNRQIIIYGIQDTVTIIEK